MRKIFLITCLLFVGVSIAVGQQKPTEKLAKAVVPGKWQVISLKTEEGTTDYAKENIVWNFGDDNIAMIHGTGLPDIKDTYKIKQSVYRRNTILILIKQLQSKAGFTWPKFIVQSVSDDMKTMWLGNWEDEFLYELKKVE